MVEYKYYHSAKTHRYEDCINGETETNENIKDCFINFRNLEREENDEVPYSFIYTTKNGSFFMMQNNKNGQGDGNCRGFYGKYADLKNNPIEYVGLLDFNVEDTKEENKSLNIELPVYQKKYEITGLKFVFPKIVDAIVQGKKVIIYDTKFENLINYFSKLCTLFPNPFIKDLSFAIAISKNPFADYYKNKGLPSINVYLTTVKDSVNFYKGQSGDSNKEYEVFEIQDMHCQKSDLFHPYSKAIEIIKKDIDNNDEMKRFISNVSIAFKPNGEIDKEYLEYFVRKIAFSNTNEENNAEELLESLNNNKINRFIQKEEFIEIANSVIGYYLDKEIIPDKVQIYIENIFRKNSFIKEKYINKYCEKLLIHISKNKELKETSTLLLIEYICSLKIQDFQNNNTTGFMIKLKENKKNIEIFGILTKSYNACSDPNIKKELLKNIIMYIPFETSLSNKLESYEYLEYMLRSLDIKNKFDILALYFLSYHTSQRRNSNCIVKPFYAFKIYVNQENLTEEEKIEYILQIKKSIKNLAIELFRNDQYLTNDFSFIDNDWINEQVHSIHLDSILSILTSKENNIDDYDELKKRLVKKCLDIEVVKSEITCVNEKYNTYVDYFKSISNKSEGDEIAKYLKNIKYQDEINKNIHEFRVNFAYHCYCTLSRTNQESVITKSKYKINRNYSNINTDNFDVKNILLEDYQSGLSESNRQRVQKQYIVNEIAEKFKIKNRVDKGKSILKDLIPTVLIWIFITILIFALLCLPPIIISILVGENILEKFKSYFKIYHYIFLFYVSLRFILVYHNNKLDKAKKNNSTCVKTALNSTLIYGMIPVLCFVVSYILTYFVILDLIR